MNKRITRRGWLVLAAGLLLAAGVLLVPFVRGSSSSHSAAPTASATPAASQVPGQKYQICNEPSPYLTSPWTYHALASGSRSYTVSQYKTLPGYGKTLPPLPSYIASESSATEAAVIYAPGSSVNRPAYDFPETPLLYFFEGGAYGEISFQTVPGDQFIGGSAPGYREPTFNNGGAAAGIDAQNATYDFSGGASTLASSAAIGATTITTKSPISGYIGWLTFADGKTYQISKASGTTITLASGLTAEESGGQAVYANQQPPIAYLSAAAQQGATSVRLGAATTPLLRYASVVIGAYSYPIEAVSGQRSGYSLTIKGGLDFPMIAGTPVYYGGPAGNVSVEYLDISHDLHNTTGTINTGTGWTITHNNIHDGYSAPGYGVAIYGGDQGTIEYNCLSRMGDYGVNVFGSNSKFDYNEVYESNYKPDPGCGCSGGGKWWGTLNADIVGNAFVNDSPGGGTPVWLDNGNSGTLISGNYFYKSYGSAIISETGFNLNVTGNLFLDGGWGKGSGGCANNCNGAVNLNSSGGFKVPGSRYENHVLISGNQFVDNWEGIDIWQAGARSCENSGEGWPNDASYCSGGFPNSASTASGGQYYFSHEGDSAHDGATTLAQSATAGSSAVLVAGTVAIHDQIGFGDPRSTKTADKTDVATFAGSGTINATTTGFPSSGELRVGTSTAWADGGGSYTGAILSYTRTTSTSFTGVSLVRGSGTLAGPIRQVQPHKVTAETCYANDCLLTVSPPLTKREAAGTEVSNAGTCQLYATSSALPSGPLAPDGISYWDGCQWEAKNISVTGNDFQFHPSVIASSAPLVGGGKTTACTAANANACGTNFMAYQVAGEAPFDTQRSANAMMSSSSFTACPSWDSGCTKGPLSNLNAFSSSPGAPPDNRVTPANNVWSNNAYSGPWGWYAYLYGSCGPLPTDPATSKSLPPGACGVLDFPAWKSYWQQDASSAFNATPGTKGSLPLSFRRPRPSPDKCRNLVAIAVAAAFAGLVVYFLSSSHAASLYASSRTETDTLRAAQANNTCTNPTIVPIDPRNTQSGVMEGNYYVTNDTWNADRYGDLSQALHVCNYNSWYAIAAMNNATGDGAVKTSPNVQETWYPTPTKLSSWKSITSQFSNVPPGTGSNYGIWEFDYDIWLNGLADSNSTEVMIWTYNNGRTPGGSPVGSFADAGQTYVVYRSPPPYQYIAFVDLSNNLSGDINLLHFFNYVISKGWMPRSSTLYQICNGVELVSTNNRSEKFAINNFSINMKAYEVRPRL